MKLQNGRQSIEIVMDGMRSWEIGSWFFCQNGYQRTGVSISVEQFEMLKQLVNTPDIVEFYESERRKRNGND